MQPTSSHFLTRAYATIALARPQKKQGKTAAAAAVTTSSTAPPPSTMSWQERGDFHLQRKELELAVEAFTKLLEQGEAAKDNTTIAAALKGLGQVFMEKEQWTFSAKLINGAYALLSPDSQAAKVCLGLMVEVERRFLQKVCGIKKDTLLKLRTDKEFLTNREQLQANRQALVQAIRKGDQSTAQLFAQYSDHTAGFLDKMVAQLYPILGKPPCKYTLVGLGSLARREMSPYSDLEFALLIENNTLKNATYFRLLVKLLELEVIHLGETEIKVLNHGLESSIRRGFSFDDGGNTPLGKESYVELLGTPQELARFQTERFFDEDLILSNVLKTVSRLVGDNGLCQAYLKETAAVLARESKKPPLLIREDRAFTILQGHLVEFEPRIDKQKEESPLFNVKVELYRLPNMLISGLADYYGIQEGNTWDKITALQNKKIISEEGAKNLKKALDAILHLRARTHLHYKRECDDVFHPSIKRKNSEIFAKTQNAFTLSDQDVDKILDIYRVLFPLHRCFQKLSLTKNFSDLLKEPFYDDSPLTQGQAHQKLHQYTQAKSCFQTALAFNPSNVDILILLGDTSRNLAELKEARDYALRAERLARETNNSQALDGAQNLLGLIANEEGDSKTAVQIFEQLLEADRRLYGNEHPDVAIDLTNLGLACHDLGDTKKGLSYLEEALHIDKKVYGNEHPTVATDLNNLGKVRHDLGDAKKAVGHYEEALCIDKKVYGEEHPSVAITLSNLGGAWLDLGKAKKAVGYFEEALRISKKVYGDEHPKVGIYLNNLGTAWHDLGDAKKAVGYFEEALSIIKKVYGEEHPSVAIDLTNLGLACHDLGDAKKGLSYLEEALCIDKKVYGDEHPTVATDLNNLGKVWHDLGDAKQAVGYYEEALRIGKKVYGEEHPSVAIRLNNLGMAWLDLRDAKKALGYLEEALCIDKKVYGDEHPTVATDLNNLGMVRHDLGDAKKAVSYFEDALCIDKKVYGEEHPSVAIRLSNLGMALLDLGDAKKAVSYFEDALCIDKKVYGEEHPSVAIRLNNLGMALLDLGDAKQAMGYLEEALCIDKKVYGDEHPNVEKDLNNLGTAWQALGDLKKVVNYHEEALRIGIKVHGEGHPKVKAYLHNLRTAQSNLDNQKKHSLAERK